MEKLEEKIIEKLKDGTIEKMIEDDQSLRELAKDAIKNALYKDNQIQDPNNEYKKIYIESPVVRAAREVANIAVTKLVDSLIKGLMEDKKFQQEIIRALVTALPVLLVRSWDNALLQVHQQSIDNISEMIHNNKI